MIYDLIVVGGGAGGFFSAISYKEFSQKASSVLILEGSGKYLTKLKVSGGGRCNVTHSCFDPRQLIKNYPRGGKNLLNAFYKFGPTEMIQWLKDNGVDVVTERDGRMFPSTHKSQTIIDCFIERSEGLGVERQNKTLVNDIKKVEGTFVLSTTQGEYQARAVVLATGSMPKGHEIAKSLGHNLTPLAPSLFTLKSQNALIADLAGVSVQETDVELHVAKKKFRMSGPVLITHWGFSGPAVLKLSSFAAREFLENDYKGELRINWLPHRKYADVLLELTSLRTQEATKKIANLAQFQLPKRLWIRLLELCHMQEKKCHELSNKELEALTTLLLKGSYSFDGKGEFKEEFVTCGGIALKEIDLKSFQSKLVPGLYFTGEIMDIDGITGGFNFQNAWTSARLAAEHLAH